MSMFPLAISCLTTSNLPWFMDLIFQVPMQYHSLQHETLLPSPVISTTGCCFCFGSISSFFQELFLHWSPVTYWAPTDLGVHLSVSYLFAFSYCSLGSQGKNTEVVCHSLLQWTMFCQNSPPWPIHLGWTYKVWLCCCCCWVISVMSDSVWPHRQQPTRLPRPWDSPGKNAGVGCHFLLPVWLYFSIKLKVRKKKLKNKKSALRVGEYTCK